MNLHTSVGDQADEPAPVGNYDQCKREEERRLLTIQERLQSLALDLLDQYVNLHMLHYLQRKDVSISRQKYLWSSFA